MESGAGRARTRHVLPCPEVVSLKCFGLGSREAARSGLHLHLLSSLHIEGRAEKLLLLAGVSCELQEPREGASGLSLKFFSPGQAEAQDGAVVSAIAEPARDTGKATLGRGTLVNPATLPCKMELCAGQGPAPGWEFLPNLNPFPALLQGEPKALPVFSQEKPADE